MIEIRALASAHQGEVAELAAFCAAHPVAGMDPYLARWIMEKLVRVPEAVLAVWNGGTRVAVAAVIDTCANADNTAELALLGLVAGGPTSAESPAFFDEACVDALIEGAEDVVLRGPRTLVEIALGQAVAGWEPVLKRRGYVEVYRLYSMSMPRPDAARAQPQDPLPEGFRWQYLPKDRTADYHRLVSSAFAVIPGSSVPSIEDMAARLAQAPWQPWVLIQDPGEHLRAFCQIHIHNTPGGRVGELRALGRDPACRGMGLGDHIMRRGIDAVLAEQVDTLELTVAAKNRHALSLYERHGFRIAHAIPTLRRRLA